MTKVCVCTKGVGFAVVGALTTAVLSVGAFGQGGDTVGSATPIVLNAVDSGTTVGYTNDYDEACPYTGSTSPDVCYYYTGGGDININMCNSFYDTKVYVYDQNLQLLTVQGGGAACNDDACSSPGGAPFRSRLSCVQTNDQPCYVIVDGYGGSQGDYNIELTACLPCILECPPGAELEGEPCNFDTTVDTFNGGCNSSPAVYSTMACDTTYCGQGWWAPNGTAYRDTDWWVLDNSGDATEYTYTFSGTQEFLASVYRLESTSGVCAAIVCPNLAVVDGADYDQCQDWTLATVTQPNCILYVFVGASFAGGEVNCNQPAGGPPNEIGAAYQFSVDCAAATPPCPWDFNEDGMVGFSDLVELLSNWGPCPTG